MAYYRLAQMKLKYTRGLVVAVVALALAPCCSNKTNKEQVDFYEKNISTSKYPVWGIDVSRHQSSIKWESVAASGIDFVFVKATEGVTVRDPMFKQHFADLKKHEIIRGAYHFFSYKSTGKDQANNFIKTVTLSKGDLPPVLDIEFKRRMPSKKKIVAEAKSFLTLIEKHYKVKPIIYLNYRFYTKYLKGSISDDYILWITDYYGEPTDWTFWQQTDKYKVKGIATKVDRNVFIGSKRELRDLLVD